MTIRTNISLLLAALALTACVNLGLDGGKDAPDILYYVLEDAGRKTQPPVITVAAKPRVLILADVQAGAFYDNDGMAFSRQAGTRGYYQFARWSDRASKRMTDLVLLRLEQERVFSAVAQTGGNVRADWLLTTEIIEMYHDATQSPGSVRLEVRADVVDMETRALVGRRLFSQNIPAGSYDAQGAYLAFNQATTRTLDELSDWLRGLSAR